MTFLLIANGLGLSIRCALACLSVTVRTAIKGPELLEPDAMLRPDAHPPQR